MDANQIKRESCPKSQNRTQSFNFQFAADCHDWFDSNSKLSSSESQVQRSIDLLAAPGHFLQNKALFLLKLKMTYLSSNSPASRCKIFCKQYREWNKGYKDYKWIVTGNNAPSPIQFKLNVSIVKTSLR
jgi:hypothetical protein